MGLAVDQQRVDGAPDIVDGGVADDFHNAGVRVDFDLADVAAVAEAGRRLVNLGLAGERAVQLFRQIDNDRKFEDIVASALWLKNREDCTGKIGVTGFCYGGSISNQLAVRLGEDLAAAVPFYGGGADAADVPNIRAAILVQHGELDTRLVNAWPAYEEALIANNVTHEGHIYPGAVHGFFNDATPERYDDAAATEAWTRTIDWFNRYVRD